jgi:hypothetical protein
MSPAQARAEADRLVAALTPGSGVPGGVTHGEAGWFLADVLRDIRDSTPADPHIRVLATHAYRVAVALGERWTA